MLLPGEPTWGFCRVGGGVGPALFHSHNGPLSATRSWDRGGTSRFGEVTDVWEHKVKRQRALPREGCGLGTEVQHSYWLVLGRALLLITLHSQFRPPLTEGSVSFRSHSLNHHL